MNEIRSSSKVLGGVLPVLFLMAVLSAPVVSADTGSCSSCGSEGAVLRQRI